MIYLEKKEGSIQRRVYTHIDSLFCLYMYNEKSEKIEQSIHNLNTYFITFVPFYL